MFLYLRVYRFALLFVTCLLPFLAFEISWLIWSHAWSLVDRPTMYPHHGHYGLLLISSLVWVLMAERYKVTSIDELFRERTGARAATSASVWTLVILVAMLYFDRDVIFP